MEYLEQIKIELENLKPREGILENIKRECRALDIVKKKKASPEKPFAFIKNRRSFISVIAVCLVAVIALAILLPLLFRGSDNPSGYAGLEYKLIDNKFYEVSRGTANEKDIVIPLEYNNIPVKRIAENGFKDANIENIEIPDKLVAIGDGAFSGSALKTIKISVQYIGADAFANCASLKEVTLTNNVKSIGARAFSNCICLESITIPMSVERIGAGAFSDCVNLKISCEVGKKPNGWDAAWASVDVNWAGDNSRDTELQVLIYNLINNGKEYEVLKGGKSVDVIIIPAEYNGIPVTRIANNAFSLSNITSIIIPISIRDIGKNAFTGCNNFKSITIPKNVTIIGEGAFDKGLTIYAEAKNKNDGWLGEWNSTKRSVVWGCELSDDKTYVVSFAVTGNIKYSILYNSPCRIGYNFVHWKGESGNKIVYYKAEDIFNAKNTGVLTAIWEEF